MAKSDCVAQLGQGLDRGHQGSQRFDRSLASALTVFDGVSIEAERSLDLFVELHQIVAAPVRLLVVVEDRLADALDQLLRGTDRPRGVVLQISVDPAQVVSENLRISEPFVLVELQGFGR